MSVSVLLWCCFGSHSHKWKNSEPGPQTSPKREQRDTGRPMSHLITSLHTLSMQVAC